MENKQDCNTMNLIDGEINESKDQLGNLKDFIKRWEKKVNEVKNMYLDNNQAHNLCNDFLKEWNKFMYGEEPKNRNVILTQLAHDLFLAISQANNNYRKQFPSFWDRFHKFKLPDLNFIKK